MPRIRGSSIEEHHEMVWADLTEAMRRLLLERDYESINMGHIAARAGLARNTLYNYARDKKALILALAQRASRPLAERVAAIAARPAEPAADRLREIIAVILSASTNNAMRVMFLLNPGLLAAELPEGPGNPFAMLLSEVDSVVRDGIAAEEFHDVEDVALTVELLSGAVRAGIERVVRDPAALSTTVRAAQEIVLAALTRGRG